MYPELLFAQAGGILAYASDAREGLVKLAEYADRVLTGGKAGRHSGRANAHRAAGH